MNVVSPDYNYADGVSLTFPEGTEINSASETSGGVTALISDNEIMLGNNSAPYGFFAGGEVIVVNINIV